jgi:hypothetical protein
MQLQTTMENAISHMFISRGMLRRKEQNAAAGTNDLQICMQSAKDRKMILT